MRQYFILMPASDSLPGDWLATALAPLGYDLTLCDWPCPEALTTSSDLLILAELIPVEIDLPLMPVLPLAPFLVEQIMARDLGCLPRLVQLIERRLRAEAHHFIEASEQRYRLVAEQTGQMVYDWDMQSGRIHWAGAIEQITGFHAVSYQDVDIERWEALIHPDDRPETMATLDKAVQAEGRFSMEYRHQRRDGSYVWVEDNGIFLLNEQGAAYRMLGSMKDVSERRRASLALEQALHEREILLQEIHHRVKNNFQVIISLLNLQLRKLKDLNAVSHLFEARNRIRSLALVHEKLYQQDNVAEIDLPDYLTLLAKELHSAGVLQAPGVRLELDLDPVHVEVEQAIPCGLLVNELLTNAFKYAFAPDWEGQGRVSLTVRAHAGTILLKIADNGQGIPADIDPESSQTLGLQLVRQLVRQLGGSCELSREQGTRWEIKFAGGW